MRARHGRATVTGRSGHPPGERPRESDPPPPRIIYGSRFSSVVKTSHRCWAEVDLDALRSNLAWMRAQDMTWHLMQEVWERGIREVIADAIARAGDGCDAIYLSVDIDVCDPGHAPGTGTPEPGGLSARELLDAVRRICLELPIVGMDVVEVSPPYDHADITAALANRVVLETLSAIARKRQDLRDGTRWEPLQPLLSERSAPIPEGTVQHHHTHLGHDQEE